MQPREIPAGQSDLAPASPGEAPGKEAAAEPEGPPAVPLLGKLEEALGCRVIAYYATSAQMGQWDSRAVNELLSAMGHQDKIGFVIQSHGGSAEAAHQMASLVREYAEEMHAYVPTFAHSAATLFVLGADTLSMEAKAELSPVDPQVPVDPRLLMPVVDPEEWPTGGEVVHVPAHVIRDFLELVGVLDADPELRMERPKINQKGRELLLKQVNPWVLGWYERAAKLSWVYGREGLTRFLLKDIPEPERRKVADRILHNLVDYYPSHGTSIYRGRARDLGIPIQDCSEKVEAALNDLTDWYERVLHPAGNVGRVLETTDGFHALPHRPEMACPACREVFGADPDFQFCPACGVPLVKRCQKCQKPLELGWQHCARCGTATGEQRTSTP